MQHDSLNITSSPVVATLDDVLLHPRDEGKSFAYPQVEARRDRVPADLYISCIRTQLRSLHDWYLNI